MTVLLATPRLYLVTDPRYSLVEILAGVEAVASVSPAGTFAVQWRDKVNTGVALERAGQVLRARTQALGVPLIVNRHLDLALHLGADGVHLGRDALPLADARRIYGTALWISFAAHSDEDVGRGLDCGANAAFVSPVFASPGKSARGLDALRAASRVVGRGRLQVVALGGVNGGNAASCVSAGADGVAVIRALLVSGSPASEAKAILQAWGERCRQRPVPAEGGPT